MKRGWLDIPLGSEWGRAGLLIVVISLGFMAIAAATPNWLAYSGDNSEYWISPHLEIYVGLAGRTFGVIWAAIVLTVDRRQKRRS
jgi:hypothetical protein